MGEATLSSIHFHWQFISELIIWSTFCGFTLAFRIITAPKKKIKVLLCIVGLHTYQRYISSTLGGEILMKSYKTCVMKVERMSYYIILNRTDVVLMLQYIIAYLIVRNSYKLVQSCSINVKQLL